MGHFDQHWKWVTVVDEINVASGDWEQASRIQAQNEKRQMPNLLKYGKEGRFQTVFVLWLWKEAEQINAIAIEYEP